MKYFFLISVAHRYLCGFSGISKFLGRFSVWVRIGALVVGIVALIGTAAVMNGLQNTYLSAVLEVGSYHIRIYSRGILNEDILSKVRNHSDVLAVQPLVESQTLFRSSTRNMRPILLRAMSKTAYNVDKGFRNKLHLVSGSFPQEGEVLVGEVLYKNLIHKDSLSLVTLPQGKLAISIIELPISGIFKTGYYDYDRNFVIINFSDGLQYVASEKEIFYAVKLKHPWRQTFAFMKTLKDWGLDVTSWEQHNRALLEALRLEKNLIVFLLSLILFVVGFGIFQDRSREIEERGEDIAILRVLGCTSNDVGSIFVFQGLILGLVGVGLAYILGTILILNIDVFFKFLEILVNIPMILVRRIGFSGIKSVNFFSGEGFYLTRIPVMAQRVENIFFCIFSLFCVVFFSVCASRRVFKCKPLEALKNY